MKRGKKEKMKKYNEKVQNLKENFSNFNDINKILSHGKLQDIEEYLGMLNSLDKEKQHQILNVVNVFYNKHKKTPEILNVIFMAFEEGGGGDSYNLDDDSDELIEANIDEEEYNNIIRKFGKINYKI